MQTSGVIFQFVPSASRRQTQPTQRRGSSWSRKLGLGLMTISLGGMVGPFTTTIRLEAAYWGKQALAAIQPSRQLAIEKPLPASVPVVFNPLVTEDGASIDPVNTDFSLVVPKIGINAPIIASVDPTRPGEYLDALQKGVAHAQTSFLPDEDGTVYLFSHSTNYDWFVRDLNAVFYLLKNLEAGDLIVVFYKGERYTYRLREKQVVASNAVSYLVPNYGQKSLILQTCWPPGSTAQRLLIFADLVEEASQTI